MRLPGRKYENNVISVPDTAVKLVLLFMHLLSRKTINDIKMRRQAVTPPAMPAIIGIVRWLFPA